jgi:hypothetical protein
MRKIEMSEATMRMILKEVSSGKSIREMAHHAGVSYPYLWKRLYDMGFQGGGYRKRDQRPLSVKVWERVEKHPNGCWTWKGPNQVSLALAAPKTARSLVHYVMRLPYTTTKLTPACGNRKCINPKHTATERFPARNETIRKLWKKHLEAKKHITSMPKLGRKYGLTRQRIEQILKATP